MNQVFNPKVIAVCALLFLVALPLVADTNEASATAPAAPAATATPAAVTPPATTPPPAVVAQPEANPGITREEVADNYLQLQEQIHASQLAIEHQQQVAADAAAEAANANAAALAARLDTLEKSVARQHDSDVDAAHKTQQITLFMAGAFGLVGLGIMLLMVYFQWRAFTQLAQISSLQHAAIASANNVHHLAAPGRATVEAANTQLLSAVDRLEQRINELEGGQRYLPDLAVARTNEETLPPGVAENNHVPDRAVEKVPDLLTEGQHYLDDNAPQRALECFDRYLATHPDRGEGLVKRASALEKLGREEEAINCYNRAIAVDNTLVIAHLHKGGLLNRLRRYDEALNCYEAALQAQEKKPALAR
jgi:tetratricopeptide (TPR) repeat protein